jgi:hypothetical protein
MGRFRPQNQAEVLEVLTSLSERDAVQRIIELGAAPPKEGEPSAADLRVLRLLREYMGLPSDLQSKFRERLQREAARAPTNGGAPRRRAP